jgi:uncharacterized protein YerC
MANMLPMEERIAVISALAEGSGIRQIERMTGVNRNTIEAETPCDSVRYCADPIG